MHENFNILFPNLVERKDGEGRAIANLGFLLYVVEEGVLGDRKKQ